MQMSVALFLHFGELLTIGLVVFFILRLLFGKMHSFLANCGSMSRRWTGMSLALKYCSGAVPSQVGRFMAKVLAA